MSVLVSVPWCFSNYNSVIQIEIRDGDTSRSFLIIHGYFNYPGVCVCVCVCVFPHEAKDFPFKICEESCQKFDGECICCVDCFW